MSRYPMFDRSRLAIPPLSERQHDMGAGDVLGLSAETQPYDHPEFPALVGRIVEARRGQRPVIVMMGAHVIKQGCGRFVCDLLRRGIVTHLAMNGACAIHDFELAKAGGTSEEVARYIVDGRFGMWRDTAEINDIVKAGAARGLGLGEAVGEFVASSDFPHKDVSVFAAAYEAGAPATVHVGIGYDIIHAHPNCDGAALGEASYTDFLVFASAVERLEGGVLLNLGTAVMGPEVYLKALSMARNVARQEGRSIRRFATAVFDLIPIQGDFRRQASKTEPGYYYRPWKTILVRTVADGGESFYFQGDHRATVPALWRETAARLGGCL